MEYRLRSTGEVVSEQAFRERHANVMFTVPLKAADAAEYGADEIAEVPAPAVLPTQVAVRGAPELVDGRWQWTWQAIDKTPEQLAVDFEAAKNGLMFVVQQHLDAGARARGYDDIKSVVTYVGDPDPVFAAEGAAFRSWRSAVWRYCYGALDAVLAGQRTIPTPEQLLAELPALVLP